MGTIFCLLGKALFYCLVLIVTIGFILKIAMWLSLLGVEVSCHRSGCQNIAADGKKILITPVWYAPASLLLIICLVWIVVSILLTKKK